VTRLRFGAALLPLRVCSNISIANVFRLALQVAVELLDRFADGVWLVELASVGDPTLVPHAVAATLGVSTATASPLDQLLSEYLHDKQLLLILDNSEHLLVACARLAEGWLRVAPQLHILATSRESLGLLSATAWQVPPLTLPGALRRYSCLLSEPGWSGLSGRSRQRR
jgi:predicted ATPase